MSNNFRAILWALIATALFAIVTAMVKPAIDKFHVLQVLFVRQAVVFRSITPALTFGLSRTLATKRPSIHVVRLLGAFSGCH